MNQTNNPVFFDNISNRVIDDLKTTIRAGSKVDIAAASFSIYAYQLLKRELEQVDELNFLFTGEVFTNERAPRESREFYIPRLNAERSLYGTDFEIKLRNELNQQAIAKECAEWIRSKVTFKSNVSGEHMPPFMAVRTDESESAYVPFNNFTTADLGADRGNSAYSVTTKISAPASRQFIDTFESIWNEDSRIADVTEAVLENITAAYKENSPELIYFTALYNIFSEFLEDLNEDFMPKEATGFKNSQVWSKLYDFQRDAVMGCIAKLEKHNGCILADSVGLGKTFSALGVIKYYESRNQNVLVLCPKRLSDNWNTFKGNYKNNPLVEDRLRYDVLYHTDLNRDRGDSNGIDLFKLNWENYDLVVIDESHNFRNGQSNTHKNEEGYENRYQKLMNKVIRSGVQTKVLMLSATPVNNRFADLRNQLMLAAEGDSNAFDGTLDTKNPVDKIFREADAAFKTWTALEPDERTTPRLLEMLHFDFFELLDSVTIARSRKHIEKYYSQSNIGKFPDRLKPITKRPDLTDIEGVTFNAIYEQIDALNMDIYTPLKYVHQSRVEKYVDVDSAQGKSWRNREQGRNILMITNLLKRLESSIYAFRLTSQRIYDLIDATIDTIDRFEQGREHMVEFDQFDISDLDADDAETEWSVGKKFKIELEDIDYVAWRSQLQRDKIVLNNLLEMILPVADEHDLKLQELIEVLRDKIRNPINGDNKKVIIFTAFADTADYLYGELATRLRSEFGINSAVVTGTRNPSTTLESTPAEFNTILTLFSPLSKNRDALFEHSPGDIDILIGTDCISEGQNLQDCDYLINYDIHWNPVRIIQRFGRIDRIGSQNDKIQLTNFWPNISLDEYINLKARVEGRMRIVNISSTGSDNPIDQADNAELEYRKKQLEKIQDEVVDIEDMNSGVSIMDLGLNEFHLDLQLLLKKYGDADHLPYGIHALARASADTPRGAIFILRNVNHGVNIDRQNRLHPFYLVYITENGQVAVNHLQPKDLLDKLRLLAKGHDTPDADLVAKFNAETNNGKDMSGYTDLLTNAIQSIITVKNEKDIDSIFRIGETTVLSNDVSGLDDFELINFLVIRD
jgi:SNF2 family DNA or RNA helicase